MKDQQQDKRPRWGLLAFIVGVFLLISMIGSGGSGSSARERSPNENGKFEPSVSTPRADAFSSSTGSYMDEREKRLYENDSTSMGYTDADRDFLREHGVSESEARAAETVLHREGIND